MTFPVTGVTELAVGVAVCPAKEQRFQEREGSEHVCIYTRMYICTRMQVYASTQTYTHTDTCGPMCIYTHLYTCIHTCAGTHAHIYARVCIYIRLSTMYIYTHLYMYVYTHNMRAHAHTQHACTRTHPLCFCAPVWAPPHAGSQGSSVCTRTAAKTDSRPCGPCHHLDCALGPPLPPGQQAHCLGALGSLGLWRPPCPPGQQTRTELPVAPGCLPSGPERGPRPGCVAPAGGPPGASSCCCFLPCRVSSVPLCKIRPLSCSYVAELLRSSSHFSVSPVLTRPSHWWTRPGDRPQHQRRFQRTLNAKHGVSDVCSTRLIFLPAAH